MKFYPLLAVLLVAGLKQPHSLYSAESKDSAPLVSATERSPHFAAVNKHLELGGELFGYADVDGDLQLFATQLRRMADSIAETQPMAGAMLQQDFGKIFDDLGLTDVKAIGLSSVRDGAVGYRNRAFFYTPTGRHGLLSVLGGSAAPYVHTKLAPANADFYAEGEVDLPSAYKAIRAVLVRVGGEMTAAMVDNQLKKSGAEAGVSALDVIQSLKGRSVLVLRLDAEKNVALPTPQPINIPAFSLLLRIDGLGATLEKLLTSVPLFEVKQEGSLKTFTLQMPLPIEGLQPVLAIENGALFLATSPAFLKECREQKAGLEQSKEFQQALGQVGREGNGLAYISPKFFSRLRHLGAINPEAAPEAKRVFAMLTDNIPDIKQPLVTARINLPDGILVRSVSTRTLKPTLAAVAVYNPVTLGVIAAMAIPAFQKTKAASQEKTVQNNLRQFAAAAQQFMLENAKNEAKYTDIVGPDKIIPELKPVLGEDYTTLVLKDGDASISVTTADGKEIKLDL
ncbi:MAG: hypothetical protein QM715_17560 [Nibricoccus sp.]